MRKKISKKRKLTFVALLALAAVTAACGNNADNAQTDAGKSGAAAPTTATVVKAEDTYPNAKLLADVDWVEENTKNNNVLILDVRAKGYEQGHIPGAVAFNSGQLKDAENNTIASAETVTELFQNLGVNNDTTILVYDDGNALTAARVFYALEYYGHQDKVKVLNGGYAAWQSAGKEVSTDAAQPAAAKGNFTAKANPNLITTKEQIQQLDPKQCLLIDTRSNKEYIGEDLRGNQKGGHIANAVNKEWSEALSTNADGVPTFKSYQELKAEFEKIGVVEGKTVIPYCQTNVRGAHTYFTLRLLGYSDIRPYEGSWAEWGNAEDTVVVK